MTQWRFSSITPWDEEDSNVRTKKYLLYCLLLANISCTYALWNTIRSENWGGALTITAVLLASGVATILFWRGQTDIAFKTITVGAFFAILIRVTIFLGLANLSFFTLFPLVVMIGILFRNNPNYINLLGGFIILWLLVVYFTEKSGYYINQEVEVSLEFKFVIIGASLLLLVFVLQIAAKNILNANNRLIYAKDEAIKAQFRAEHANRTKTTFLANMSHELRTPLNAIIGYSEMIAEEHEGETKSDSQKIETSARNLLTIISSILEISKIETGSMDLDISEFSLNDLIEEVEVICIPQIGMRGNKFVKEIEDDALFASADRQKVCQILINLLNNANKFTADGEIQLQIKTEPESLLISVSDTGIGISKEDQSKIFEPFQQVNNELNRSYNGAGLGLAICKQFAELMGGELRLKSQLGEGSTFTLSLPR